MPVKLFSKAGADVGLMVPATEEDKAMLIRTNTRPPGIKGLLRIPTDPVYITAILFMNLFTSVCVIFDFTVELQQRKEPKIIVPLEEGSCRHFIFCMDFIIVIDILLSIIHRKVKMYQPRSITIILIDFISSVPYEMIYVVLKGTDLRVYFGLRLRYILRICRYISGLRKVNSFKLCVPYVMGVYIMIMCGVCFLAGCIRLQIYCMTDHPKTSIIQCEDLTVVDIVFTYAILNGQMTYSAMLFVNDSFAYINTFDTFLQMIVTGTMYMLIPQMICIMLENEAYKYQFCMTGNHAVKALSDKQKRNLLKIFQYDNRMLDFLKQYMASYWNHYQMENIQTIYVGNFKPATIPGILYTEMTLDLSWNMFKHSILLKNESVAFLRQLSKLTVFSFGTKNDIIYQQGKTRSIMIYIIKGIVSLMSENTGRTPLMSFSGGTVFGELSLFLNLPTPTTLYCESYCEYMVLSQLDFLKIRKIYPEVYNRLRRKCLRRVDYAKNYDFIAKEMYENGEIAMPKSKLSLRYIKTVLRCYMETPVSPLTQSIFIPDNMTPESSLKSTIFNAHFIPLYVEADKIESNFKRHFTVSGWNFKLRESSTLYRIWRFGITFLTLVDCIFYPLGAAQDQELFTIFYDYFVMGVNVFYIVDFLSHNFISIKHRGIVLVDSELILMYKIQTSDFWFDLIAALPIEVIFTFMQNQMDATYYRLLGVTRLIKIHKVLAIVNNHLMFNTVLLMLLPVVKSAYGVVMILFFGYLTFHRFGYFALTILDTGPDEMTFWDKLNIVYQFYFSMGEVGMKITRDVNLIPMILLQIAAFWLFSHSLCSNATAFSLLYTPYVNYENQVEEIKRIFVLFKFPIGPRKRVMKYLKLMYDEETPSRSDVFSKMMGKALYKEHCIKVHFDFISKLQLFKEMSKPALSNMCQIAEVEFIPRGELIVMAGSLVKYIYFIMNGRCEYTLKDGTGRLKPLKVGDAILLFEAFLGHNAMSNVIAITDVRIMSFSVYDLRRKLCKFPFEVQVIMNAVEDITTKQLGQLQTYEPRATPLMEENQSCRYFDHIMIQFYQGFGFFRMLGMFFMKKTITPFGRFWFAWEITHVSLAFFYSFFGTIPVTVCCDWTHYWFWLFRILDLFFLVDIYLHHHVIYFNEYNVEVPHPWACATHYWKTTFLIELLATIPVELIVIPMLDSISITTLSILRMNRHLRFPRFRGLLKYLNYRYMKTYKLLVILTYMCLSLLMYNFFLVLLFEGERLPIISGRPVFRDRSVFAFWTSYASKLRISIKQTCSIGINEGFADGSSQLQIYVLMNAMGQFMYSSLLCIIIAMSLGRRMHLMIYQIKMQRLVIFMNVRKFDKNLRNEIIRHFEYLWSKREGKSMMDCLETFSRGFNEEILYSYYAPTLQKTLLFMDYPKVILKDLLSTPTLSHDFFLITGIVVRVNDVHDKIYIVYKGQVQVLGPDMSHLRDLQAGSIFGCLDNVPMHRSTLTYVAKTHCEFLSISSVKFHEVMSKYPRYYRFYMKLLKSSNYDYLSYGKAKATDEPGMSILETLSRVTAQHNRFVLILIKFFPVMKQREYVKILFIVYIVIAFQYEVMLITFLYKYPPSVVYIAYASDLIFLIKIYFDFSTEYEDQYGLKIRNRRMIAIKYFHELLGLWFHFFTAFPLDVIVLLFPGMLSGYTWAFLRSNRLLRVILVFQYIRSVRNRLNINVRLIKSLDIFLVLYTTQQFSIIILSNYISDEYPYLDALVFHSYFVSKKVYTPFKDNIPDFTSAVLYKFDYVLVLLFTQLVCVLVIADCVAAYQMLKFSRFRYETFFNDQRNVMQLMAVSTPLYNRVRLYGRALIQNGLNVQYPDFLIGAPYYLREGILDAMYGFHVRSHPVFKLCHSDFNRQVAATFKTLYLFEGDFVTFQGDIDGKMYFIHSGEIEGLVEDNLYYDVADSKYFAGDYFGFHQLMYANVGHAKTYKVVSKMVMLLAVKRHNVLRLLDFFPATKYVFYNPSASNDGLEDAKVEYRDYLKFTKGIHE